MTTVSLDDVFDVEAGPLEPASAAPAEQDLGSRVLALLGTGRRINGACPICGWPISYRDLAGLTILAACSRPDDRSDLSCAGRLVLRAIGLRLEDGGTVTARPKPEQVSPVAKDWLCRSCRSLYPAGGSADGLCVLCSTTKDNR